jgi:hypothetical protein
MSSLRFKNGSWHLRYYENGKQKDVSLSTTDEDLAKRIQQEFDSQKIKNPKDSKLRTFGEALDNYLRETNPYKTTLRQKALLVYARKLEPLRDKRLTSITSNDIKSLLNGSYSSRTKLFQLVKNVYQYVWSKGQHTPDPTYGVSVPGYYETKRERFFTIEELRSIKTLSRNG